ncbi:MAG TPA: metallophosphoesterase [Burkholderiaceae bacterium]|nr:metallophosphoesterase [Burkholderiaceae bacterium]
MTSLVQLSDPHFGAERPQVVEALVEWVREQAPALVVLSGDLTQRARPEQWEAVRCFVGRLAAPAVVAIPGNHDIPLYDVASRALRPYAGFARVFGETLEPVHADEALLVVSVNTTRPWRHKDGTVSSAQVERVARRLERAEPGQLRVVVTHQPICTVRAQDEVDRLRGAEAAARRWIGAGVDLVLGGHIHLPYVAPMHAWLPDAPRRAWAVQAGTAVSHRVRHEADNSVNLVRRTGDGATIGCEVERWDWSQRRARFERVERHVLQPDRRAPGVGAGGARPGAR